MKFLGPLLAIPLALTPLAAQDFRRGDANLDAAVDIADAIALIAHLFVGGPLPCELAGDATDDETINIGDPIMVLGHLFDFGPPISPPFPHCGADPTPGALSCADIGSCVLVPQLAAISTAFIRPGDILTLVGSNFDPIPSRNRVAFVAPDGIELLGAVESVAPALTSLEVRVPSGVRSGVVELEVRGATRWIPAGGLPVVAAPVILGCAVGIDGQVAAVLRDPTGQIFPDQIVLYGHNLAEVTGVVISDDISSFPSPAVAPGLPADVTYALGGALEALTVGLPSGGLLPSFCTTSPLTFIASAPWAGGSTVDSTPFEVPYALITGAAGGISDISAFPTGVITPAGIRSGDVEVVYNLLADPSPARWDVAVEYQDPGDPSGATFVLCTPAAGTSNSVLLLPGVRVHPSSTPGIIGPGATYRFVWDTAADLPAGSGTVVTRLRLRPHNPVPSGVISPTCAGELLTDWLVIDTDAPASGAIAEDFTDISHEDPSSTADWVPYPGILAAAAVVGAPPAWGEGTVDVLLAAGTSVVIDTDSGSIVDVTDPGNPLAILSPAENPGASAHELHVRTLTIEAGAAVVVAGATPLVVRCSGDGTDDFLAAQIAGVLDLDGSSAIAATDSAAGIGGGGGPGGGDGGDGGHITVDQSSQEVTALVPSTRGDLGGGGAGPSTTFVAQSPAISLPKAGCGGGGGHATPGESGINTFSITTNVNAPSGLPGRPYGDAAITRLRGGSGGGGGGAAPIRLSSATSFIGKHGGGGGGGGGAFELVARGSIEVAGSITCDGANGSKGGVGSGNQAPGAGGGGAGGAIALRATGDIALGLFAILRAAGGNGAVTTLQGTNTHRGGNGAPGRIRLEANGALPPPALLAGLAITPAPSVGAFATAGLEESIGATIPYVVGPDGIRRTRPAQFGAADLDFASLPATTHAIALFEGAHADPTAPQRPGEFFGLTDDLELLDGVEFIRARIHLYRATVGGPPELDSFEVPF